MPETINLLTIPEAAKRYSLSKYTLHRWVKEQRFTVINSGRKVLIYEDKLINFLKGDVSHEK
ncbi:MAG: helix-turn-helix domain-containing protein [Ruminococcus sp.]|nr:helix-turn-helix domain-containing protein [Ruminococcus sp.]